MKLGALDHALVLPLEEIKRSFPSWHLDLSTDTLLGRLSTEAALSLQASFLTQLPQGTSGLTVLKRLSRQM